MTERRLLAGASGYSFKEWCGTFYPDKMDPDAMLPFYAARLPSVEINNTFYRMPRTSMLENWAQITPPAFRFAIKASRRITHMGRLKVDSVADSVDYLYKNLASLGDKRGPVLFQLPPNLKKDLERLQNFLTYLPAERRYAFEFRHESWFDEDVYKTMRDRDVAMCVAEQADFKCPVVCTASWGYLRLHKLDYDQNALEEWAKLVMSQSWSEAYVYFKHDEGAGSGPPAVEAFVKAAMA